MAVAFSGFMILFAIMAIFGKVSTLKGGVILLMLDLILLALGVYQNKPDSEEIFMVIIVGTLRIILRGLSAQKQRVLLMDQMEKADREYEEEKKTGIKYCENEDPYIDEDIDSSNNVDTDKNVDEINDVKEIIDTSKSNIKANITRNSFCTNCGAKVEEENNFCEQCGAPVDKK